MRYHKYKLPNKRPVVTIKLLNTKDNSIMDDMGSRVLAVRNDPEQLNNFIAENKRFVLTSAYYALNRYVSDSDDEYSIALMAYAEAIETYDESKGNFQSFAAMVIKRRLIDYLRTQSRHAPELYVEPYALDADLSQSEDVSALQMEIARKTVQLSAENAQRDRGDPGHSPVRDEIEALQQLLERYGFSFFDLAECSPHADKTKKACAEVVTVLLNTPELFENIRRTRSLPAKELARRCGVRTKLLDKHRRYIIAAAEILNGEYPLLAEYMSYIRRSMKT